jgi:hypothetical protein
MTMLDLQRKTTVAADDKFRRDEVTIVKTEEFAVPDNHWIKVTACWRSMSSTDGPAIVKLSITDKSDAHKQEQLLRIDTEDTGQAGGEMSKVLKVMAQGGDITAGRHLFKLRAVQVMGEGKIEIQAATQSPIEIRVEDLGSIPSH